MVQGDRVSWVRADRTAVRFIGKESPVNGDYLHSFTVCIEDAFIEDELNRGLLRLWEVRNDWTDRTWIYARKTGEGWTIHFEHRSKGTDLWAFHGEEILTLGVRYRVELGRTGDGYSLRVLGEDGEVIVGSGNIEGVAQNYAWVWLSSTIKARRNRGNWSSGYIEGFEI
jgi:hypothetical protein